MGELLNAGMRHHSVVCRCGCAAVITTDLFDWGDDSDAEMWIDFSLGYHAGLRHRLEAAWRVIRGREPWLHSIEVQRPEAEVLISALQRLTKSAADTTSPHTCQTNLLPAAGCRCGVPTTAEYHQPNCPLAMPYDWMRWAQDVLADPQRAAVEASGISAEQLAAMREAFGDAICEERNG